MSNPRVVCVLGVHRSGTSALSRAMSVVGIELGEDLISPYHDNPKGFFEDREVLVLNEELLRGINRNWASVGILETGQLSGTSHGELFERAVGILENRTSRFPIWGFKDPRTSLLLPFWQKAFKLLGLPVAYIISLRNPISVGESLRSRNNFPYAWSQIMWLQHYASAFRHTAGEPRLVVDYDQLMSDPRAQLRRMAALIGGSLDECLEDKIQEYCDEFLDPNLRHSRFPAERLKQLPGHLPHLIDFFEYASRLAKDDAPESGLEAALLNGVNDYFQSGSRLLDLLDNLMKQIDNLQDEIGSLRDDYDGKMAEITALRQEIDAFHAERISHLAQITSFRGLQERVDWYAGELAWIKRLVISKSEAGKKHWLRDLISSRSPVLSWKRIRDARTILRDGLFDSTYYLEKNIDVAIYGIHPLAHFVKHGAREGRDPGPHFDTSYYLEQNADVARSCLNPLVHFILYGRNEGRSPQPEPKKD